MDQQPTLFVDLDGTLTYSDTLIESFLELIKRNPLYLFLIPVWLLKGRARLKHEITMRTTLRVDLLPYHEGLLEYLRAQKDLGRRLVLISASNQRIVDSVAEHIGLFESAIGSSDDYNCAGHRKLACIRKLTGSDAFDYAGNAYVDLAIWRDANAAIVVNASENLRKKAEKVTRVTTTFPGRYRSIGSLLGRCIVAMRLHQWLKNLLLFLPLVLSHQVSNDALLLRAVIAFFCFGLCASSVYILNDLLDMNSDRQHRRKKRRPFASGDLTPLAGLIMMPLLLAVSFGTALLLPDEFLMILVSYYLTTCLYSFVLKKIELVDVITLATLYTLRIIAGAAAVSVIPSFWLLAFSMFLFMSLAIIKRFTELSYLRGSGIEHTEGRGYLARDLDMLAVFGCTSALMSVMVFALYINSEDILQQYSTPEILWFICPLLLYLVCRIWLLAFRGEIEEDPVIFALTDGISQVVTIVCIVLLWMANLNWNLY